MGSDEEGKALATPEFWDSRYDKADGENPTHEWFRSFSALKPFFEAHLFMGKPAEGNPRIIHLGSGDSVGQGGLMRVHRQLMKLRRQSHRILPRKATRINFAWTSQMSLSISCLLGMLTKEASSGSGPMSAI